MSITILFFGATADATGNRKIILNEKGCSNAGDLVEYLRQTYPKLRLLRLLFSINQKHANGDEAVNDRDEIAIFTAVSGG